jgi:YidC/Oxa1 family membrane protein insertase
MDRNQIIGIGLITAIFTIYIAFFAPDETVPPVQEQKTEQTSKAAADTAKAAAPVAAQVPDSVKQQALSGEYGVLAAAATGTEQEVIIENKNLKIAFSSHGIVSKVWLKNYSTFADHQEHLNDSVVVPILIVNQLNNKQSLKANVGGKNVDLYSLYYKSEIRKQGEATVVVFTLPVGNSGATIQQLYTLGAEDFNLQYDIKFNGLNAEIADQPMSFEWSHQPINVERGFKQNQQVTTVNYFNKEESFDHLSETSVDPQEEKESSLKWFSFKQKFFNVGIVAANSLDNAVIRSQMNPNAATLKDLKVNATINSKDAKEGKAHFTYFFGPNHYTTCKNVTDGYEKNVYLGWPVINVINRFIVIPVFNFFESFVSNYGVIIIILVILLKLLLFPLSWKSYISMAKMRVMKPELDEIKAKFGDDQQKIQSENMLLYQKVGVNPLSGCLPVLMQMPIILAMFNFFPNAIELRQQPFLWSTDLSTYDTLISWSGDLPLITWALGGNHLSVFTLAMTVSTLIYTWFNNQVSTVSGPMVYMSYVMPLIFLFVLNSFPAGLSFYYLVSNVLSIVQQLIIRRFVDEGAIRAQLDENSKKIASGETKKNRFMARLEEAAQQQKEIKKNKKK